MDQTTNTREYKRIVLEGNICSGKTTLIEYLKENIKREDINVVDSGFGLFHPNLEYNILRYNNEDPKNWTFLAQVTFMQLLNKLQNKEMNCHINVFNRSIFSVHNVFNQVYYEDAYLTSTEYGYLNKLYKKLIKRETKQIDLLIFFKSETATLETRATTNTFKRYIPRFQTYYDKLLKIIKNDNKDIKNIYIIDSNKSLDDLKEDYKNILNIINE
ncbi:hypothetical protein Yalta_119 [Yalta virus]|nr:hypothetical protein Yalta_119 [Yalta virus]